MRTMFGCAKLRVFTGIPMSLYGSIIDGQYKDVLHRIPKNIETLLVKKLFLMSVDKTDKYLFVYTFCITLKGYA